MKKIFTKTTNRIINSFLLFSHKYFKVSRWCMTYMVAIKEQVARKCDLSTWKQVLRDTTLLSPVQLFVIVFYCYYLLSLFAESSQRNICSHWPKVRKFHSHVSMKNLIFLCFFVGNWLGIVSANRSRLSDHLYCGW